MEQHNLRELMDACRGAGRDLSDPEMQPLREALRADAELQASFGRAQQFDERIRRAVRDVPVPATLEKRLLEAASAASGQPAKRPASVAAGPIPTDAGQTDTGQTDAGQTDAGATDSRDSELLTPGGGMSGQFSPAPIRRRVSRRAGWLLVAAATAAGLLLAVSLSTLVGRGGRAVSEEQLVAAAQAWFKQAAADESWHRLADQPPPADRALPGSARAIPRRWTTLAALDDPRAVVYELVPPRGDVAGLLFVVKTRRESGLAPVPYQGLTSGGVASGFTIAAWQTPELLYVLVLPADGPSPELYVPSAPAV